MHKEELIVFEFPTDDLFREKREDKFLKFEKRIKIYKKNKKKQDKKVLQKKYKKIGEILQDMIFKDKMNKYQNLS